MVFRSEHVTIKDDVTIVLDVSLEIGESAGDLQPVLTIFPQEFETLDGTVTLYVKNAACYKGEDAKELKILWFGVQSL